jgi:hypothetical protein
MEKLMTQSEKTKLIAKILKAKFPGLPTDKAIHVAYLIVEKLDGYVPQGTTDGTDKQVE